MKKEIKIAPKGAWACGLRVGETQFMHTTFQNGQICGEVRTRSQKEFEQQLKIHRQLEKLHKIHFTSIVLFVFLTALLSVY